MAEIALLITFDRRSKAFTSLEAALKYAGGITPVADKGKPYMSFIRVLSTFGIIEYYVVAPHRIGYGGDDHDWLFADGYRYRRIHEVELIAAIELMLDIEAQGTW